jgi:hypothetical protein
VCPQRRFFDVKFALPQTLSRHNVLSQHSPQTMGPTDGGPISKTVIQNKPFLFLSHVSQLFCFNNGKLSNKPSPACLNTKCPHLVVVKQLPAQAFCVWILTSSFPTWRTSVNLLLYLTQFPTIGDNFLTMLWKLCWGIFKPLERGSLLLLSTYLLASFLKVFYSCLIWRDLQIKEFSGKKSECHNFLNPKHFVFFQHLLISPV